MDSKRWIITYINMYDINAIVLLFYYIILLIKINHL